MALLQAQMAKLYYDDLNRPSPNLQTDAASNRMYETILFAFNGSIFIASWL